MRGIFKNINASAELLHPKNVHSIPRSYVELGMSPGQVMEIDIDEVESLMARYDESRFNEYVDSMHLNHDDSDIRRRKKYMSRRKHSLGRWVDTMRKESADGKHIYCTIETVDHTKDSGVRESQCYRCVLSGICQHFPICRENGYPDIIYSKID